jgi:hypothetical protein
MTSNIPQGNVTKAVTNTKASCFDSEAFLRAVTEQSGVYPCTINSKQLFTWVKQKT